MHKRFQGGSNRLAISVFLTALIVAGLASVSIVGARATSKTSAEWCVANVAADDVLNVRIKAGVGNQIIGHLPPASCGVRLDASTDPVSVGKSRWVKVTVAGFTGWVNSRYLSEAPAPVAVAAPAAPAIDYCVTKVRSTSSLNLRAGPGQTHKILAKIPSDSCALSGRNVTPTSGWRAVTYNGPGGAVAGWVSADFVKSPNGAANDHVAAPPVTVITRVAEAPTSTEAVDTSGNDAAIVYHQATPERVAATQTAPSVIPVMRFVTGGEHPDDPFLCNGQLWDAGEISGFFADEPVRLSFGDDGSHVEHADSRGIRSFPWKCNSGGYTIRYKAEGLTSGRTLTFDFYTTSGESGCEQVYTQASIGTSRAGYDSEMVVDLVSAACYTGSDVQWKQHITRSTAGIRIRPSDAYDDGGVGIKAIPVGQPSYSTWTPTQTQEFTGATNCPAPTAECSRAIVVRQEWVGHACPATDPNCGLDVYRISLEQMHTPYGPVGEGRVLSLDSAFDDANLFRPITTVSDFED